MDKKRNDCPVYYALSIINGKWKLLIIWHLSKEIEYNTIPPRVEYSLTDLGYSLEKIITMLGEWGEM